MATYIKTLAEQRNKSAKSDRKTICKQKMLTAAKYESLDKKRECKAMELHEARKSRRTSLFNQNRKIEEEEKPLTKEEKLRIWKEERKRKKEEDMKRRPPFNRFITSKHTGFSPYKETTNLLSQKKTKPPTNIFGPRTEDETFKVPGRKTFNFQMPATRTGLLKKKTEVNLSFRPMNQEATTQRRKDASALTLVKPKKDTKVTETTEPLRRSRRTLTVAATEKSFATALTNGPKSRNIKKITENKVPNLRKNLKTMPEVINDRKENLTRTIATRNKAPKKTVATATITALAKAAEVSGPSETLTIPKIIVSEPEIVPAPSGTVSPPSEIVAVPSGTVSAPSETVAAPSETVAAPSETVAAPSETVSADGVTDSISAETVSMPMEGEKAKDMEIGFLPSPFVQIIRGKRNRPRPSLNRSRRSLVDVPLEEEIQEPPNGPTFQRKRMNAEKIRLLSLAEEWRAIRNSGSLPTEILGEIDSVVGYTFLLVSQPSSKFGQFDTLINACQYSSEAKYTCSDLDGFWDMMYIQVAKLDASYEQLQALRRNNWKQKQDKTEKVEKKNIRKKIKNTAQSKIKDLILAKKREISGKNDDNTKSKPPQIKEEPQEHTDKKMNEESEIKHTPKPSENRSRVSDSRLSLTEINLSKVRRSRSSFGLTAIQNSLREKALCSPIIMVESSTPMASIKSILKSSEKFTPKTLFSTPPNFFKNTDSNLRSSSRKVLFELPASHKNSLEKADSKTEVDKNNLSTASSRISKFILPITEEREASSPELAEDLQRLFLEDENEIEIRVPRNRRSKRFIDKFEIRLGETDIIVRRSPRIKAKVIASPHP